ncbi:MAG: hypothetical protein P8106_02230 [Gammaproteobacteria bacterium]|jgi:hypothetical protein
MTSHRRYGRALLARLLCGAALAFGGSAAAQNGTRIEIFAMQARPPQELVPVLQPLVGPGGSVTSMGNQLIVKGTPEQLGAVRGVLKQLDKPPQRLLIEVRVGGRGAVASDAAGLRGGVDAHATPDSGRLDGRAEGYAHSSRTRRGDDVTQFIRAVEGRPAFIAVGQEVPIREFVPRVYLGGVARGGVQYRAATTGFHVVPWVHGERVTLQISQHADRYEGAREGFGVQRADTTINGELGRWIPLGGSAHEGTRDERGPGYSASTRGRDERDVEVRVTRLGEAGSIR